MVCNIHFHKCSYKHLLVYLLLLKTFTFADSTYPATRLRLLPLQLAIIGKKPFVEAINLLIIYSGDIENYINSPSLLQVTYKLYKCMDSIDITVVVVVLLLHVSIGNCS